MIELYEGLRHGMPRWLRRLLYCAINLIAHTGDAQRQTCRRALYSFDFGQPLRHLRQAGTPAGVQEASPL